MIELKPHPPNTEDPVGYVDGRKRGKRIIIVVDDFFDLPKWSGRQYIPATAAGLQSFYNITRTWEMRRGIGFFNLPDPTRIEADSEIIIKAIQNWLNEVCCDEECEEEHHSSVHENYHYYLLVDVYFGGGDDQTIIGHKFIEQWKKHQIVPVAQEKIAYFSIAGAYHTFKDPHDLPIFQKSADIDRKGLPIDLRDWLDFEPVPLEKIWEKSVGWFDDDKTDIVRHNFSEVEQWFNQKSSQATSYQQKIESALGFQFPAKWWEDLQTVKNIHESLKHFCGEVFCGNTSQDGRRNLSVGAAYLIALKAHAEIYGNFGALANDQFWQDASRVTAAIFPLQGEAEAKSSAISLYDFFYRMFQPNSGSDNRSQVKTAFFEQAGVVLKIQLTWNATRRRDDRSQNLVQVLSERFDSDAIDTPDPDNFGEFDQDKNIRPALAKNTRDAISRLWRSMMFNKNGFLSPGVIYMEKDEIIIASTEYLVWGEDGRP